MSNINLKENVPERRVGSCAFVDCIKRKLTRGTQLKGDIYCCFFLFNSCSIS